MDKEKIDLLAIHMCTNILLIINDKNSIVCHT